MFGLFIQPNNKAAVYVLDSVRTNQMPNMNTLYNSERNSKLVFYVLVIQGVPHNRLNGAVSLSS